MTPSDIPADVAHAKPDNNRREILAAQVKLLYDNLNLGIWVTLIATPILARLQWTVIPHTVIFVWSLYMVLVSAVRYVLGRQYLRLPIPDARCWNIMFAIGAGLAGIGWAAAGI